MLEKHKNEDVEFLIDVSTLFSGQRLAIDIVEVAKKLEQQTVCIKELEAQLSKEVTENALLRVKLKQRNCPHWPHVSTIYDYCSCGWAKPTDTSNALKSKGGGE